MQRHASVQTHTMPIHGYSTDWLIDATDAYGQTNEAVTNFVLSLEHTCALRAL